MPAAPGAVRRTPSSPAMSRNAATAPPTRCSPPRPGPPPPAEARGRDGRVIVEARRTPDERFASLPGFPWAPRYLEWTGLRLHYLDEGAGPPVVLFHGEPPWGFLYRKVAVPLVAGRHP